MLVQCPEVMSTHIFSVILEILVTQIGYHGVYIPMQQMLILGGHLGNMLISHLSYYTLYHPKRLLVSKNTFPDFEITRIGHLRAEMQQIIDIWWPFWIMQIRCFPILGFLRTFSMVFWGRHRNSLWQKNYVTICSKRNCTLPGLARLRDGTYADTRPAR